jgi:hypothetical protein
MRIVRMVRQIGCRCKRVPFSKLLLRYWIHHSQVYPVSVPLYTDYASKSRVTFHDPLLKR